MSDFLRLLEEAARPYKEFDFKIGETNFRFATRVLSQLENDILNQTFNKEFDRIASEMESGSVDTTVIKRGLQRQSKENLAKLVVRADHQDYLQEASTELDDKPFSDEAVINLAKEKEDFALTLLLQAEDEEVLEQALERRAFVVAMIKATDAQNLNFLAFAIYRQNEEGNWVKAFKDAQEISDTLDRVNVSRLINAAYDAVRGVKVPDPLKSQARKRREKLS